MLGKMFSLILALLTPLLYAILTLPDDKLLQVLIKSSPVVAIFGSVSVIVLYSVVQFARNRKL